jgi:hypothetical protein
MFTLDDLRALLNAQPFVPFRLWLSDGGSVDVRSRELVFPGRRFAIIGLLEDNATDSVYDRYTTVWYLHVARHEMLNPGIPPFTPPSPGSASPAQA